MTSKIILKASFSITDLKFQELPKATVPLETMMADEVR